MTMHIVYQIPADAGTVRRIVAEHAGDNPDLTAIITVDYDEYGDGSKVWQAASLHHTPAAILEELDRIDAGGGNYAKTTFAHAEISDPVALLRAHARLGKLT